MGDNSNLNEELAQLEQEYLDQLKQIKENEEKLGKKLSEKESILSSQVQKLKDLEGNYESLKSKHSQNDIEKFRLQAELDSLNLKIKKFEDEKKELESLNDQWEKSAKILEYSKQNLEEKLYQAEENAIIYQGELEELTQKRLEDEQRLREEYQELKQELVMLKVTQEEEKPRARCPTPTLRHTTETCITIVRPKSRPSSRPLSRKGSIDELASKQNVKVIVAFKPPSSNETWDSQVLNIDSKTVTYREKGKENKVFEFEKIFKPGFSQPEIFDEIKEGIDKLFEGGNACILAYGQTGSGKTYTMNSMINLSLLRFTEMIGDEFSVSLQCIEVYNEQLKNLLNDDPLSKNWKDVLAKSEVKLGDDWKDQAWDLVQTAISRRTTKFTESNERSSRSHAIITINLAGPMGTGKVQFVDLAGSERIGKSQVVGDSLKEALLINKSLTALQDVITALENRQKHVPYRNSTLTQILQPTLGGSESLVTMIMNCSPALDNINETICTLSLASRVKAVDLGFFIRKSLVNKEVERTLSLLERERSEKNSLLRTLDKLQRDLVAMQVNLKDKDCRISALMNKLKQKESRKSSEKGRKMSSEFDKFGSLSPKALQGSLSPSSRIPMLVSLKLKRDSK